MTNDPQRTPAKCVIDHNIAILCYLVERKPLLVIFSSLTISSVRICVYAHVSLLSSEKKELLWKKVNSMFSLISGGHIYKAL